MRWAIAPPMKGPVAEATLKVLWSKTHLDSAARAVEWLMETYAPVRELKSPLSFKGTRSAMMIALRT